MKFLKGAIIFLLGAGAGASASYVYFKKLYDEKKEELNELKNHYSEKLQKEADKKTCDNIIKENEYVSYNALEKKIEKDELVKLEREVEAVFMTRDNPIVVIDEPDYSERELYFDKLELDYYIEDGALVDENEDLVVVDDSIGYDNLEEFISNESEDVMYVRNYNQNADYMVRKVFGKYSDVIGVGGEDDD